MALGALHSAEGDRAALERERVRKRALATEGCRRAARAVTRCAAGAAALAGGAAALAAAEAWSVDGGGGEDYADGRWPPVARAAAAAAGAAAFARAAEAQARASAAMTDSIGAPLAAVTMPRPVPPAVLRLALSLGALGREK